MPVFGDYVGSYKDLVDAYNAQNQDTTNAQGRSVINPLRQNLYHELAGTLTDFQNARENNKNWEHYVWTGGSSVWKPSDGPSDLDNYWNSNADLRKAYNNDKAAWGKAHYESNGQKENREVPFNGLGTVLWNSHQYIVRHSQLYGNSYIPNVFQKADGKVVAVNGPDGWGQQHWEQSGQNETRILPGAKIGLNASGSAYIANPNLIGAGAKSTYDSLVNLINNASSGNYSALVSSVGKTLDSTELNDFIKNAGIDVIEASYTTKISPWDGKKQGAQPPFGAFNANYYGSSTTSGANALKEWKKAQSALSLGGISIPDLDITKRYTQDSYLHWHYTTQGKAAGARGNSPLAEETTEAYKYTEKLTDYEKQLYRDQVLGITTDPLGQQKIVIAAPQYDEEGNLINEGDVDTLLEKTFAQTVSGEDLKKENMLETFAQDVLKMSIDQLKKAKLIESNLSMMSQLPGYNEIMNINTTLANSIIGDSGIGGILNLRGAGNEYQKELEKNLGELTGVSSNSTIYNWQKWFDETLLKKYENYEIEGRVFSTDELKSLQKIAQEDIDIYNKDKASVKPIYLEIAEKYKEGTRVLNVNDIEDFKKIMMYIDKESNQAFVKSFVDDYLKPRFDQSKSMDEFVSYLDVKEEEQNVFQSQTTINKIKQIADLRTRTFLDLMQSSEKAMSRFDPAFYLDPVTNNTKQVGSTKLGQYQYQKELIAADFENAKKGIVGSDGIDWATQAYIYGYEGTYKTDPKVFAKLHYQAKGSTGAVKDPSTGKSILLDPAQDILPYDELAQKIKDFGVEMAARKEFYGGAGFMKFVTPEEFADAVLGSVSPEENKEEWDKILQSIGLEGTDATIEQVKEYLIEQLRTEEAKNIRESIKYLNENQEELNQKTLGVSYIERPTDVKTETGETTFLYDVFKNAGYGGTEDDFYNEFFPDVDRTEQQVISKLSSGQGLESSLGDMDNPFAAFVTVGSLFEDDSSIGGAAFIKDPEEEEQKAASQSSYFKIFEDEEEELPEKSAAATSFLKDFTSLFKGFN